MDMATTTHKEQAMKTIDLGIKIAELQLQLIKAHGPEKHLPGTYDQLVADAEARIAARIANRQEVAA